MADARSDLIHLTADIVSAHVSNNNVPSTDVAALIKKVYDALEAAPAKNRNRNQPSPSARR